MLGFGRVGRRLARFCAVASLLASQAAFAQAPAKLDPIEIEIKLKPDEKAAEKKPEEKPSKPDEKKPEEKKKDDKKPEEKTTFVVGDDVTFTGKWDGSQLRFRTGDEAFNVHVGARFMSDAVWWDQSPNLRQPTAQPPGSPLGFVTGVGPGVGSLTDGFLVRRARLVADGTLYQTIEFKTEFNFDNYVSLSFNDSYVGVRDLPCIDTVRIGQMNCPFGLESYSSSRALPLMERSPLFDSFYPGFAPGVFTSRTYCEERITTEHMFHRMNNFSQFNGTSFGDGKYASTHRITALPVYEADGRCLLHLGLAYQWRKGSTPSDFNGGTTLPGVPPGLDHTDLVRFRARASLRDSVGLQGDAARVVDTGNIIADHVNSLNAEFLAYAGPLWLQSEACMAHVSNAVFPASPAGTDHGDPTFYGAYTMAGYLLTGENRGYDRRFGKYDRVKPLENFFLVRDECGCTQCGLGAWEIVYRFTYVNLTDHAIAGGTYAEHNVGLNWYWNQNIKLQLNYINGQRLVPEPAVSGNVQGVALRAALEF